MHPANLPAIRSTVEGIVGSSGPETTPVADPTNTGTAVLTKGGALVGFFPDDKRRFFEIEFTSTTDYELRWREEGSATWNLDPSMGRTDADSVFYGDPSAGVDAANAFIHRHFWTGSPAVGDKFTFEADPTAKTIEMPVLFKPEIDRNSNISAGAYTTDHANSLVSETTVVTGDTYGPEVDFDGMGAKDILEEYVTKMFVRSGYTEADIHFADARLYHNLCGSLHCGTNVQREVPDTYNWWEAP